MGGGQGSEVYPCMVLVGYGPFVHSPVASEGKSVQCNHGGRDSFASWWGHSYSRNVQVCLCVGGQIQLPAC